LVPQPVVHLEVQVRAGGVTGGALVADDLTGADPVSHLHRGAVLVGVVGQIAVAVVDDHRDAVSGVRPAGRDDGAGGDGADRGVRRHGQVDTGVQDAPAHAVAGG